MSERRIDRIHQRLEPLRSELLNHPIYGEINCLEKLHLFMQHHVFAVWDFMSLLKSLQNRFCNTDLPWQPPPDRLAARFINEIVLGEETDEDGEGGYASHFELYHRAMKRCGATTAIIDQFLAELRTGQTIEGSLTNCQASSSVQSFVLQTFEVIDRADVCEIGSAFLFGREDLLPGVFQRIIESLNQESAGKLNGFLFYLNRHIELDEGHHGPMAARLISSLCGENEDRWQRAEDAAVAALQSRKILWDGMQQAMQSQVVTGSWHPV